MGPDHDSRGLLELEHSDLRDAAMAVMDSTNGNECIQWDDVSSRLSHSQWNQLTDSDLMESTGHGYRFEDRQAIRHEIVSNQDAEDDSGLSPQWSLFDKMAGITVLVLFVIYPKPNAQKLIGRQMNVVLGPVTNVLSFFVVVFLLAAITSLISLFAKEYLEAHRNDEREGFLDTLSFSGELRRFQEAINAEDEETLEKIEQEQYTELVDATKITVRKLQVTLWPTAVALLFLIWVIWYVYWGPLPPESAIVLPIMGKQEWTSAIGGLLPVWFFWYGITGVLVSSFVSKTKEYVFR